MDDASYKRLLNHRRIMQDLLIGFIAPRRPAGWAGALDFGSLRELPTENITDELRRRLGDVVWSIDRRAGDGGVQTLHVVIEHQSDVDYSMPLRFLNYTSLLYQRLYRDRTRWSKRDTADPVLQVVVYNGDRRWDAPVTLAGLVAGLEQDGPAQLALSYEVVDLVALKRDDLPRPNLLTWVAEVEQSVHAGALPDGCGSWESGSPHRGSRLTRPSLWLGAMGRKWGWSCQPGSVRTGGGSAVQRDVSGAGHRAGRRDAGQLAWRRAAELPTWRWRDVQPSSASGGDTGTRS